MKVIAVSKEFFKRMDGSVILELLDRCAIISINDSGASSPLAGFEHKNLLFMYFDDITTPTIGKRLFHAEQAQKIVDFVCVDHDDNEPEAYIIHCNSGCSRSGAIAEWIDENYNKDPGPFYADNPHITPNKFVRRLLTQVGICSSSQVDFNEREAREKFATYSDNPELGTLVLCSPYDMNDGFSKFLKDLGDDKTKPVLTMPDAAVKALAEEAFNTAIRLIQDRRGVKTGDQAAHFFSSGSDVTIIDVLDDYIESELFSNRQAEEKDNGS